jgi:hypothetical protein
MKLDWLAKLPFLFSTDCLWKPEMRYCEIRKEKWYSAYLRLESQYLTLDPFLSLSPIF